MTPEERERFDKLERVAYEHLRADYGTRPQTPGDVWARLKSQVEAEQRVQRQDDGIIASTHTSHAELLQGHLESPHAGGGGKVPAHDHGLPAKTGPVNPVGG